MQSENEATDLAAANLGKRTPMPADTGALTNSGGMKGGKLRKPEVSGQLAPFLPSAKPELSPVFHVSPDPRDQVQLSATNGIVTVQGSVGSQELAQTLVKKYRSMAGVREVRNRLTIRTNHDAEIAAQLRGALSRDPGTHVGGIAVTVCDGIVFLSGEVLTEEESTRAEELARGVPGVMRVSNGIRVPTPSRYPVRLTSGVKNYTRAR